MTPEVRDTVRRVLAQCLDRIHSEKKDFQLAAEDVASKLAFLDDYLSCFDALDVTIDLIEVREREKTQSPPAI